MFTLATPWLLFLLPIPFLLQWILPATKNQNSAALKLPFYRRILALKQTQSSIQKKQSPTPSYLCYFLWALLVFAAAGPQWLGTPQELPQSGRDIMLAVDLSGSMRIPDMQLQNQAVNRLDVVKSAARKFITARSGDRLGLVLFGTKAYLQTPLTFDLPTINQMLDDATIGLAGTQTAIGDAIGIAIKSLEKAPGNSKVIILLTDGGNNAGVVSPLEAANIAASLGIKIYTIGIGARQIIVSGLFGPQVIQPTSDLDENSLKQIAQLTHGLFFRAENTADLQRVYQNLNQLIPVASAKNIFRPITPLYPWPLGAALILSIFITRKKMTFKSFTFRPIYLPNYERGITPYKASMRKEK